MARTLMILALISLLFGCEGRQPYVQKGGVWYFGKQALDAPKGERLTVLNARFAKSRTRAWYRAWPMPEVDAKTFQALDDHHARDATRAWYAEVYRDSQDYFTTERVRIRELEGVDPARLKALADHYAVDGTRAYYEGRDFPVTEAATFAPLTDGFAHDRVQGYYQRVAIAGSDGASFQVLGAHFARDARSVFHAAMDHAQDGPAVPKSTRVEGADPATFQVLEYDYARDAQRAYHQARALPGDVATFQELDFGYAKTATAVFHNGVPMKGVDPATFAILPEVADVATAQDAHGLYKDGKRVSPKP